MTLVAFWVHCCWHQQTIFIMHCWTRQDHFLSLEMYANHETPRRWSFRTSPKRPPSTCIQITSSKGPTPNARTVIDITRPRFSECMRQKNWQRVTHVNFCQRHEDPPKNRPPVHSEFSPSYHENTCPFLIAPDANDVCVSVNTINANHVDTNQICQYVQIQLCLLSSLLQLSQSLERRRFLESNQN